VRSRRVLGRGAHTARRGTPRRPNVITRHHRAARPGQSPSRRNPSQSAFLD
jgi:hypothetical protein